MKGGTPLIFAAASMVGACSVVFDDMGSLTGGVEPAQETESSASDPSSPSAETTSGEAKGPGDGTAASSGEEGGPASPTSPSSAYAASVLADAPVAYFRLEETSGAQAKDEVGGAPATLFGVKYAVTGADGTRGVDLDGETGYIDLGSRFSWGGRRPITFELWVEPRAVDTTYRRLLSTEEGMGSAREGWSVSLHSTYGPFVERYLNGTSDKLGGVSAALLAPGALHHVVVAYDGAELRLHIDGVLHRRIDATRSLLETGRSLTIGKHATYSVPYLAGVYDEIAVYDTALSAVRVRAHYDAARR